MLLDKLNFCNISTGLRNMMFLGVIFMFLFTAFFTMSNLEKTFLVSKRMDDPSYTGDGYVSLCILYISFAIFMWFVPSIISLVGPRIALTIGACGYSLFIASFFADSAWVLYLGSVFNGMGASLLWTCQGDYSVLNSTPKTITRNFAIFEILFQFSTFYGNGFLYFIFRGKSHIDHDTRTLILTVLIGISFIAIFLSLFLPNPRSGDGTIKKTDLGGPLTAFKKAVSIGIRPDMLILSAMFLYTGLQISFVSGVYGACVGFTHQMKNSTELIPLVGFCNGVGQFITHIPLAIFGKKISVYNTRRCGVIIVGMVSHLIGFFFIFINIPNNAVFGPTDDKAIIEASPTIAVSCALLLGLSDGITMPMIISLLGIRYPNEGVQAITVYIFCMSFATSVGFLYSLYIGLYVQLVILSVFTILGGISYCYISMKINDNEATRTDNSIEEAHAPQSKDKTRF